MKKVINNKKEKKIRIINILALAVAATMLVTGCGNTSSSGDSAGTAGEPGEAVQNTSEADGNAGAEATNADNTGKDTYTGPTEQTYTAQMPTGTEQSSIYVEAIDGLPADFIKGMDISSLLVEEASGVKYYDADGNETDLLKILADAGVNCVRIRVWNDPFDSEGHGYGGGNCTAETAAIIGSRAAAYGIKTCVDFHYSDFWADPKKQMAPKAWADMELGDKKTALYEYTYESLHTILNAGADVSIVQIGNEINPGMAGVTAFGGVSELLNEGSKAVRTVSEELGLDMKVAVHYTGIDSPDGIMSIAEKLMKYKVDYDIFGVSYYPFWHGTFANMQKVLTDIHETYGVDTCVMETSYMYTEKDGDETSNSVSALDALDEYPVGTQGQANCVRDVCAYANEAGALGVFYWEGAWIPVPSASGSRSSVWEEFGSGWASSYAAEYDPGDAGVYYGGCSWDNQAFFDFDGNVLDSINVFKYLNYGATGDHLELIKIPDINIACNVGGTYELPTNIAAVFNDSSYKDGLEVTGWKQEDVDVIDTTVPGDYVVNGVAAGPEGDIDIQAHIVVANINYVQNGSFEDPDYSMWKVKPIEGGDPTDFQNKSSDAHTDSYALHFWSQSDMNFEVTQDMTIDKAGSYQASAFMQGGDFNPDAEIYLFVRINGEEVTSAPVKLDGWVNWKNPTITGIAVSEGDVVTIGAYVDCDALAWATFDDFVFSLE